MLVHWIWLSQRKAVTIRQKLTLLEALQDAEEVYRADEAAYSHIEGMTEKAVADLMQKDLTESFRILTHCMEKNISILTFEDRQYPDKLKNIHTPPIVLYYKGMLPKWQEVPVIGVVGTRRASAAGLRNAEKLGYEIAACGGMVASGGADGIDTAALKGALYANKPVIAVLGFGADVVYPAKNRSLFAQIQKQGCLITEFAPGTPPNSWNFPMRNRIISGLSSGVLVVEAPARSGALNTANHALDQGKDLFVVPGNIDQPSCVGSNALLKERAIAISTGWEILEEYAFLYPHTVRRADRGYQPAPQQPEAPGEKKNSPAPKRQSDKNSIDNRGNTHYSVLENASLELSDEEKQVVQYLSDTPMLVDSLLDQVDRPSGKVLSLLTMLALKGVVTQHAGNRVSLRSQQRK